MWGSVFISYLIYWKDLEHLHRAKLENCIGGVYDPNLPKNRLCSSPI